jgi:CHASE2 domain-containing sensor protein
MRDNAKRMRVWLHQRGKKLGAWVDREVPAAVRWPATMLAVVLTLAIFGLLLAAGPLLGSLEHWTTDFRTAFFTYRLDSWHKDVALVLINEEAIAEAQKDSRVKYRSPIDRGLLARIIKALEPYKPRVVGLDVIVDQASDPTKDDAFFKAIKEAPFPIVLARLDIAKTGTTETQRVFQDDFLRRAADANPSVRDGYVTLKAEEDGIVRTLPTPASDRHSTFSEAIAKASGWTPPAEAGRFALVRRSDRIAWLQPPRTPSTTFLTIPAMELIAPPQQMGAGERELLGQLKGRSIIVGVRFQDYTDRHRTPFSKTEPHEMSGVEINAHVVAQLIDGHSYTELTVGAELALCFVTAFVGAVVGWRYPDSDLLFEVVPLTVYVIVNTALFWLTHFILPFAGPGLAWYFAIRLGSWLRRREERRSLAT